MLLCYKHFLGGCKHAFAFLMWLNRRSEEPAPTEVTCYWKKYVLASSVTDRKFISVLEMCGVNCEENIENQSSVDESSPFLLEVISNLKQCQLKTQISPYKIELDHRAFYSLSMHQLVFQYYLVGVKNSLDFLNFAEKKFCVKMLKCKQEFKVSVYCGTN